MAITGDFVNGLHLMVGLSTDNKPETTSENTFFLEEDSGDVYYFSEGEWKEAPSSVGLFISNLLGGGQSGGGDVTAAAVVAAIEAMTNAQKADAREGLDAAQTPMIVEFSEQGGVYSASESLVDIKAALAAGRIVSGFNEAGAECRVIGQDVGNVQFAAVDDSNGGSTLRLRVYTVGQSSVDYFAHEFQWAPGSVTISDAAASISPNNDTVYKCGTLTSLTIAGSALDISFSVDFDSGATPTSIFVPSGYKAPGGDLTPEANKTYELNVRNGKAVLTAFEAVSASA